MKRQCKICNKELKTYKKPIFARTKWKEKYIELSDEGVLFTQVHIRRVWFCNNCWKGIRGVKL